MCSDCCFCRQQIIGIFPSPVVYNLFYVLHEGEKYIGVIYMVGIEAPWHNYYKKVYGLFNVDKELNISDITENGDGSYEFTISSKNGDKLCAIESLLGYGRVFGNTKVLIRYAYENGQDLDWSEVYRLAFEGNPFFKEVIDIDMPFQENLSYAVFNKDIITFYDDNLSDIHGNSHYIVADIVKDVVADTGLFVCTDSDC